MNKLIKTAVPFCLFLFAGKASAQEFTFGPKVGYNQAELKGISFEEFHDNNSKDGFHVGLFAE
ncbi:MAG TPA: hypothetical protein VLY87_01250, partial [Flavobacterium sp.]|nr:hypothetical protein [Flavobacterium sp.]